jgi:long-chain fatty acid transport protein
VSTISVLIAATCLWSGAAFGSGFSIFEQGAKATGMGGAFAATADDPSAIFYNVAGIAQQRELSVIGGGTFINFNNQFIGDPNDAFTAGTSGKFARHTFVPPNGYAIVPIGDNFTFGIGMFSAFGLRTHWEDPWIGRFSSRDANLKTASVQPSLAWQNDAGTVAIGGGVEYRRAHVILSRNTPFLSPLNGRIYDVANAYLDSDWNSGLGYNVGILLKPTSTIRIGASYRTDMTIEFGGDATFTQISTGNPALDALVATNIPPNQGISADFDFPAIAIVGIATTAIPGWDIEFDMTRTTWSKFEALRVQFDTTPAANLDRPQDWHDTSSFRLGGNRRVNETWDVRLGAVYDQNPQPIEAVSPLLPDSDRFGVSFGVAYRHGPFTIEASDLVLHFKDRSTNGTNPPPDRFNGTYKTNANLISVNVGLKF